MLPELTRRQIIIWAATGAAIFILGANYLYQNWSSAPNQPFFTATTVTAGVQTQSVSGIQVHVTGAVVSPGLYELRDGDRVADAIERAGGPAPSADLSRVNLAARVVDGQQVLVPLLGAAPAASDGGEGATRPVSLNGATLEELTGLDGVGPKTAQKIIDYREAHGGFKSVDELLEVPGIGPAKFEQLREQVTL